MSGAGDLFAQALGLHRAGRLRDAEVLYRRILVDDPAHADSLHLLGVIAFQAGRVQAALDHIGQALAVRPHVPEYHGNLGLVLAGADRVAEAEAQYREALRLLPDYPEASGNLGNLLDATGRGAEAEPHWLKALALRPNDIEVMLNLADYRRRMERLDDAEHYCRRALALDPAHARALSSLGLCLQVQGRAAEAESFYRAALRVAPESPLVLNNLGAVLRDLARPVEAEACYRAALRLKPDYTDAVYNLGAALLDQDRPQAAVDVYRRTLDFDPAYAQAHNNMAVALQELGRTEAALAHFTEAIRQRPDFADGHYNLAMTQLLTGHFAAGWREYEWRWQVPGFPGRPRGFAQPLWQGEEIGDRTLLLHAEQGFGDTIQFCRYAVLAARRGRVLLEVQPPLVELMRGLPGIEEVLVQGEPLPAFDLQCPLLSLPRAFGTDLQTIPGGVPYLTADPMRVARWQVPLAGPGLRVGLAWAGRPSLRLDRRRSMPLDRLRPLAEVPGVTFVSLQKGEAAAQAASPPSGMVLRDWTDALHDFAETAALIMALDLVISVDTAVVHLAGALGKPVWLLNRFDGEWRWLLDRDDSPWYPTLRQFRQPSPGDWGATIERVRQALAGLAKH